MNKLYIMFYKSHIAIKMMLYRDIYHLNNLKYIFHLHNSTNQNISQRKHVPQGKGSHHSKAYMCNKMSKVSNFNGKVGT